MELRSMVLEKSSHSHAHIVNPSDGFGNSGPQATDIDANHDVSEKKGEICSVRMQEKKEERRIFVSPSQYWLQHFRQAYIVLEK
jgi:hypothetical protein